MNLWIEVRFLINSFSIGRTCVHSIKSRDFRLVSAHFGYFIVNFHVFEGALRRSESVFDRSQSSDKIFGPFFFIGLLFHPKSKINHFRLISAVFCIHFGSFSHFWPSVITTGFMSQFKKETTSANDFLSRF